MIENDKILDIVDFNAAETVLVFFRFQVMQVYRTLINSCIRTVKSIFFYSDFL